MNPYTFMEDNICDMYKEILKNDYIGGYENYPSAHGDKFRCCNSGFKERSVEEPIGTMIAMLISYSRKYKKKYEQNNYSMDWFWKTFDSIIKQNKSTIDNYNLIWKIENQ